MSDDIFMSANSIFGKKSRLELSLALFACPAANGSHKVTSLWSSTVAAVPTAIQLPYKVTADIWTKLAHITRGLRTRWPRKIDLRSRRI